MFTNKKLPASEIHSRYGSNTLSIQYDILGTYSVLCTKSMPCCIDVCIQILLTRFSRTHAITGIIVTKDITIDSLPETNKETGHLSQINCIAM